MIELNTAKSAKNDKFIDNDEKSITGSRFNVRWDTDDTDWTDFHGFRIRVIRVIRVLFKFHLNPGQNTIIMTLLTALYHFPVIFKIRLTPIDANLRQQMRKSVKSASKIITGITGFWNSAPVNREKIKEEIR